MNKVLSVLAVAAILGVSFYAGHKSFGSSVEYEHQDVLDFIKSASLKCKTNEFTGKCKSCTPCSNPATASTRVVKGKTFSDKYKAGGCSYFKDTFCTLCTSIPNCRQENTFCTTKDDQYCDKCEDGFYGPQCTPCTVCSSTEYVSEACVSRPKAKDFDTVCVKCSQCSSEYKWAKDGSWKQLAHGSGSRKVRSFLSKRCRVGGNGITVNNNFGQIGSGARGMDSQCTDCRVCRDGFEFTDGTCKSPKNLKLAADPIATIQKLGKDTKCTRCTGCMAEEHPDRSKLYSKHGRGAALFATAECKDTKAGSGLYNEKKGHAKCQACATCNAGQFIERTCNPGHPHKEWLCKKIVMVGGKATESGTKECDIVIDKNTNQPAIAKNEILASEIPMSLGWDTKCKGCTKRPAGHWTVFPCNPKHTSDAVHQKCSTCVAGEYTYSKCKPFSDTICPSCPNAREKLYKNSKEFKSGLQYCKINAVTGLPDTQCTATEQKEINADGKKTLVVVPRSTKCGNWKGLVGEKPFRYDGANHQLPKNLDRCLPFTRGGKCGEWQSNCKEDFYGQSCCYHKSPYSCGVITTRERSAKRLKYPSEDAAKKSKLSAQNKPAGYPKEGYFAQFCMSLCSEFPDCLAVEIEDKGTAANPSGTPDESDEFKKCYFKSAFTQDQRYKRKGNEPHMDCYSNTCRQNIYTMAGNGKPLQIINYKIPAKKNAEAHAQAILAKELAVCVKKCEGKKKTNCKRECLKQRKQYTAKANSKLATVAKNAQ